MIILFIITQFSTFALSIRDGKINNNVYFNNHKIVDRFEALFSANRDVYMLQKIIVCWGTKKGSVFFFI
jgi:hypothetical protein